MRRRGRTDRNQPEIVRALRKSGCSVQVLSAVGEGCPDILVGWQGLNVLMEIKDPLAANADKRLTPDAKLWHENWRGQVAVIETAEQALNIMRKG